MSMQVEGSDKKMRTLSPDWVGWLTEFILTTRSKQHIYVNIDYLYMPTQ